MKTITVNMHEAKTTLSKLSRMVERGHHVVIARNGTPVVDLVPHKPEIRERIPGLLKGRISMSPDFTETPEDVLNLFES